MPERLAGKEAADQRDVAALITTVLGAAISCRRAATLGVSPRASCSASPPPISPTTTSPV